MRYLFRKGLEVNSRSRYVHLSWGRFELDEGNTDNARELFRRGHSLNPQDAPLLQVPLFSLPSAPARYIRLACAAHNAVRFSLTSSAMQAQIMGATRPRPVLPGMDSHAGGNQHFEHPEMGAVHLEQDMEGRRHRPGW